MSNIGYFNNKYCIIRDVILVAFCAYCISFLFNLSDAFWKYIVIILEVYCIIESAKNRLPNFERSILFFVGLTFLYAIVWGVQHGFQTTFISKVMLALPSFWVFRFLGEKGVINEKWIMIATISLFAAAVIQFNFWRNLYIDDFGTEDNTIGVNIFVFILPLLFLIRKRLLASILFIISLYFILIGAKRGLILCSILPLILYIKDYSKGRKNVFKWIGAVIFIILAGFVISNLLENDSYLMTRYYDTLEGDSSGRDIIYSTYLNQWSNSDNILNILFGYGSVATEHTFLRSKAHSDWIEVLFDYGILGIILYVFYFINLIKLYVKNKKSDYSSIYLCILWICGLKSIFSFVFFDSELLALAISYGYVVGKQYNPMTRNIA